MLGIEYFQAPGRLGEIFEAGGTSNVAKVPLRGSLVVTGGQPGFDLERGELVTSSLEDEADACFNCVDAALKSAGVAGGLAQAHRFTCFLSDMRYEAAIMKVWRARMPSHKVPWVTVGVSMLAIPDMRVEIAAEALTDG
ncbi:Endoribonuclease L-PSP/chorismate mutase-like protein [Penicillium waksmanii]|uniref:Endoribonuclease L-PSP/chorismate mutase-like protein n=1 Tax=Penicillium waksmanii TaxID=69791 RepID=UPI0025468D46|nr:Endoribonuclease L-PSP/chorismate mutase-like protein [Penicillium waksmanii]KAJ5976018.1 Endoribonuclease L-PSP/chorismate mutase-like protein [Penicillium waksmanii]